MERRGGTAATRLVPFPSLTLAHWITLHVLVTVTAVLFHVVASHAMGQRRQPAAAIAWILFMLLLPYLALPAFLAFGSRKLARPRSPAPMEPSAAHGTDRWAIGTILALGQSALAAYRDLRVHEGGHAAREALLDGLDSAQHSIDLCTFILGRDSLGGAVVDRLCARARDGIRVRLLLDGFAHPLAGHPEFKRLTAAGGACTPFVPPLHSPLKGRTNLRDHRKLLVTDAGHDSARLWCGGRNLATEYFDDTPGAPAWHDLSFDLRGPFVGQASALFEQDWAFANGQPIGAEGAGRPDAPFPTDGAQLVASGPDQADDTVYSLLVAAAYRAGRRIALVTPYFVPESALLLALCLAARRGVSVDLLLPARSNHRRFATWFGQERAPACPYVATQPGLIRDMAEGMLLWLAFQL